jgi:AAA+ ATPase superfamily predicted ATPase
MTMEAPFFGRNRELERLRALRKKKTSSLVVLKGRRRIGKSRLIKEFGRDERTITLVGLPPEPKTTAQDQRTHFAMQMERILNVPALQYAHDWDALFFQLSLQSKSGKILLVFDEINWMGSLDHTFLGKLKTAWDELFKVNPQLIMILSGSMSVWIENNILRSTGFVGRTSLEMSLEELPLHQCQLFWGNRADRISNYEKFKVLSVTGGVPRYLEEIDPSKSADENIVRLAFEPEGILSNEFEKIFHDLFQREGALYRSILTRLADGPADLTQIAEFLQSSKGGYLSTYLQNLVTTGYVACDETWNLSTGKVGRLRSYRLKDNYIRFYLKYIKPNRSKILKGGFARPPSWDTIMGLQFENLVLNNSKGILRLLNLSPSNIVFDNPFFQRKTAVQRGCQIDYLVQTNHKVLYVCEIKFSRDPIPHTIVAELEEKIRRINAPKHFSFIPVLIHVNGVSERVEESGLFGNIIDFSKLLNAPD